MLLALSASLLSSLRLATGPRFALTVPASAAFLVITRVRAAVSDPAFELNAYWTRCESWMRTMRLHDAGNGSPSDTVPKSSDDTDVGSLTNENSAGDSITLVDTAANSTPWSDWLATLG